MALPETVPYLDWRWDDLVFLVLAGILLGAALLVVLGRDIIRSGLWLVLSFAGLAGIYALLGSAFMAAAQVLVYMGAISVLILFAIMITQSKSGPARLVFQRQWWAGGLAAAGPGRSHAPGGHAHDLAAGGQRYRAPGGTPDRPAALRREPLRLRGRGRAPPGRGHRRPLPRAPRAGACPTAAHGRDADGAEEEAA